MFCNSIAYYDDFVARKPQQARLLRRGEVAENLAKEIESMGKAAGGKFAAA
jgi:hypothetical protein